MLKTALLTCLALAANSVLCRLALGDGAVDAGLGSSIVMLLLVAFWLLKRQANDSVADQSSTDSKASRDSAGE